ncbi:macrolide ABC transporter ATP-binding protein [Microgenomates group bacterium RBG_16_45_19]|nr:MAG: macrolide ABC transporter ATP-binding protein [Microgenomates group bacterium RBG_16_45_19]
MTQPVLVLKDISKVYRLGEEDLYALNQVSLTINEGEFLAVVGPSGCGKSTFLHIASLLDYPTQGIIQIKGMDTMDYTEPERARLRNREIGFIFQQFNLLAKTNAIDNVALPLVYAGDGKKDRERRAREMLEQVGLGDRLSSTPSQLSGGQQQRVAIARALVNQPSLIFADEPTGNLDSRSGEEIKKIIIKLNNEGKTIVMVTHDREIAKIAKRIVALADGRVVSDRPTKWARKTL